jgi:membrane complex biogenesis BtpA family protein
MRALPPKFIAAMIAVRALPGSPRYDGDNRRIIRNAIDDLEKYEAAGVDSVILENDHDLPYIQPPICEDAIRVMTRVAREVRKRFDKPIGIQILEAANEQALEVAYQADLDYLRVEGYCFAHVGGAGIIQGSAGKLLRLRKALGCEHISVFADVKKKHCAHALTGDLDLADVIKQSEFFMADGIVITGQFTGVEPAVADLDTARKTTKLPVIIGSGMTAANVKNYFSLADGFIVGSTFRRDGQFLEELDPDRLAQFVSVFQLLRAEPSR